jgi:hypothetical protein
MRALVVAVLLLLTAPLVACASTATSRAEPVLTTTSTLGVFSGLGTVSPPAPSSCVSRDGLPDPRCTPGATDPRVTQANIASTICTTGYAKTVRPPTSYTNPLKKIEMRAYGDTGPLSTFELDHLIPLEIGGAPRSALNLWPEPWNGDTGATSKDHVENALHKAVCNGTLPLAVAQQRIATNWKTALGSS